MATAKFFALGLARRKSRTLRRIRLGSRPSITVPFVPGFLIAALRCCICPGSLRRLSSFPITSTASARSRSPATMASVSWVFRVGWTVRLYFLARVVTSEDVPTPLEWMMKGDFLSSSGSSFSISSAVLPSSVGGFLSGLTSGVTGVAGCPGTGGVPVVVACGAAAADDTTSCVLAAETAGGEKSPGRFLRSTGAASTVGVANTRAWFCPSFSFRAWSVCGVRSPLPAIPNSTMPGKTSPTTSAQKSEGLVFSPIATLPATSPAPPRPPCRTVLIAPLAAKPFNPLAVFKIRSDGMSTEAASNAPTPMPRLVALSLSLASTSGFERACVRASVFCKSPPASACRSSRI